MTGHGGGWARQRRVSSSGEQQRGGELGECDGSAAGHGSRDQGAADGAPGWLGLELDGGRRKVKNEERCLRAIARLRVVLQAVCLWNWSLNLARGLLLVGIWRHNLEVLAAPSRLSLSSTDFREGIDDAIKICV